MSDSFSGRARILDLSGSLVDVGKAELSTIDHESGTTWGGVIKLYVGAALATKRLQSVLELDNGRSAKALVGPQVGDVIEGELVAVKVVALDDEVPF